MTLTEQLKKGELGFGWYYITTTFTDGILMEWFDGDEFRTVFTCNVKEVLSPIPSYEEWQHQQMSLRMTIDDYKNVVDICEQLKELLKECKLQIGNEYITENEIRELYHKIDNAIGEKK